MPAGELKGGLEQLIVPDPHDLGSLPDAAVQLVPSTAHVGGTVGDILVNGLLKELILRVLEDQPHLKAHIPDLLGLRPDVLSVQQNLSGSGTQQSVKMLNQGGLSGPGMADDAQEFPVVHVKAHILHGAAFKGRSGAVSMGEIFYLQNRFQSLSFLPRHFTPKAAAMTSAQFSTVRAVSGTSTPSRRSRSSRSTVSGTVRPMDRSFST